MHELIYNNYTRAYYNQHDKANKKATSALAGIKRIRC